MYITFSRDGKIEATRLQLKTSERHSALVILRIDADTENSSMSVEKNVLPSYETRQPTQNTLLAWVIGGLENTYRSVEITPVKNHDKALVRVKLIVQTPDRPAQTAEGEGDTIQDAFAAAYTELVAWLT